MLKVKKKNIRIMKNKFDIVLNKQFIFNHLKLFNLILKIIFNYLFNI